MSYSLYFIKHSCLLHIFHMPGWISIIFGSNVHNNNMMCRVKHSPMLVQGQGHSGRSKVIFTLCHQTFVSAPYLPHACMDFNHIWNKCSQQ